MEYNKLRKDNAIPKEAHHIGVYDNDGNKLGNIRIGLPKRSKLLYSFGLMSDVHYNDGGVDKIGFDGDDDGSQYYSDFVNAFTFYKDNGVSFVCASGDISTNSRKHAITFKMAKDSCASDIPFYTCMGNHDNCIKYTERQEEYGYKSGLEIWKENTFPSNNPYETVFFDGNGNDTRTFYFLKPLENGKNDVFIFLSLDYGENTTTAKQTLEDGSYRYYDPNVLNWFEGVLEHFKNDRCFIFTHLFFPDKAGNCNHYYSGNHSGSYILTGSQHDKLNELNNKYKNNVWFTGHSHYKWEYQESDMNANVCNYDYNNDTECAYNVHIPSTTRPIFNSPNYNVDEKDSQGGIVEVYEDHVEVIGVDFKTELDESEEESKKLYTKNTITADEVFVNREDGDYNSEQSVEQDGDYVKLIFTGKGQEFIIRPKNYNPIDYLNYSMTASYDEIHVYLRMESKYKNEDYVDSFIDIDDDYSWCEITNIIKNEPKIGFYSDKIGAYTFERGDDFKMTSKDGTGGRYSISSSFHYDPPVMVRMKCRVKFYASSKYGNQILPIAHYWLPISNEKTKQ